MPMIEVPNAEDLLIEEYQDYIHDNIALPYGYACYIESVFMRYEFYSEYVDGFSSYIDMARYRWETRNK